MIEITEPEKLVLISEIGRRFFMISERQIDKAELAQWAARLSELIASLSEPPK